MIITAYNCGQKTHPYCGGSDSQWQGGDQDEFLESMAEATQSVVDYFEGKVLSINVMNRMSVDCDCSGAMAAEPEVDDIGIHVLEHGKAIGLGSRQYELVSIDV